MSFWIDNDQSVYRPHYTLLELERYTNFEYHNGLHAHTFSEKADNTVELVCNRGSTKEQVVFKARRLIIAAGTMSTTRLVLRSMNKFNVPVPLLSNPYTYVPTVNLNMLGQVPFELNHSLAQLAAIFRPVNSADPQIHMTIHTYRSLLNFKLVKETPFPYREGMSIIRHLVPALAIIAFSHQDRPSDRKICALRSDSPDTRDYLDIKYQPSDSDVDRQNYFEQKILWHFMRLKCVGFKKIRPGHAASIHYGGTLPMCRRPKELSVDTRCNLFGTTSVYIADASVFPVLPARGQTFAAMANANRVSEHLCLDLKQR